MLHVALNFLADDEVSSADGTVAAEPDNPGSLFVEL